MVLEIVNTIILIISLGAFFYILNKKVVTVRETMENLQEKVENLEKEQNKLSLELRNKLDEIKEKEKEELSNLKEEILGGITQETNMLKEDMLSSLSYSISSTEERMSSKIDDITEKIDILGKSVYTIIEYLEGIIGEINSKVDKTLEDKFLILKDLISRNIELLVRTHKELEKLNERTNTNLERTSKTLINLKNILQYFYNLSEQVNAIKKRYIKQDKTLKIYILKIEKELEFLREFLKEYISLYGKNNPEVTNSLDNIERKVEEEIKEIQKKMENRLLIRLPEVKKLKLFI